MPSAKTEATELSLAFGAAGIKPLETSYAQVETLLCGTVSIEKFEAFLQEYQGKNRALYERMWHVGDQIRQNDAYARTLPGVHWTGPDQMPATVSMAKDVRVGILGVSVKAFSDVIYNISAHNLFVALPKGELASRRTGHWYVRVAPEEYHALYEYARSFTGQTTLPPSVSQYEEAANRGMRKTFQAALKNSEVVKDSQFTVLYRNLAVKVSTESAKMFNTDMAASLLSLRRRAMLERIAETFFRFNSTEYILAGIDRRELLGVKIPDLSVWMRKWKINKLVAESDLNAGQPQCWFSLEIENIRSGDVQEYRYRSEIRWTHGKFGSAPEGKLYKDFAWRDVPFFTPLL